MATAPVLVLVGAMMMGESHQIEWTNMLVAVPAFLTIVVQPFTFSIANGIYAGLLMSALVYLLTGAFVDVGREWLAAARGRGALAGGEDGGPTVDVMDNAEAALAGGAAPKFGDDGGLEAPLLGNGGGGQSASDLASLPGGAVGSQPAGATTEAISIGQRRGSGSRDVAGSLSRSHPYERGSFQMFINTAGSHTAASHLGGSPGVHGGPSRGASLSGGLLSSDEPH